MMKSFHIVALITLFCYGSITASGLSKKKQSSSHKTIRSMPFKHVQKYSQKYLDRYAPNITNFKKKTIIKAILDKLKLIGFGTSLNTVTTKDLDGMLKTHIKKAKAITFYPMKNLNQEGESPNKFDEIAFFSNKLNQNIVVRQLRSYRQQSRATCGYHSTFNAMILAQNSDKVVSNPLKVQILLHDDEKRNKVVYQLKKKLNKQQNLEAFQIQKLAHTLLPSDPNAITVCKEVDDNQKEILLSAGLNGDEYIYQPINQIEILEDFLNRHLNSSNVNQETFVFRKQSIGNKIHIGSHYEALALEKKNNTLYITIVNSTPRNEIFGGILPYIVDRDQYEQLQEQYNVTIPSVNDIDHYKE